jgi:6-phospho-beta-glucosidase
MKLALLGGGGFRVPLVYRALSTPPHEGLITHLALYDPDAQRLAGIAAVLESMPALGRRPELSLHTTLEPALEGAQVVFAAIRQGSTAGRVQDERIALRRGQLGQETVGAGGLSYALRSIPEMLRIAEVLRRVAPEAWLINFTNPAGMVTQALHPVLGGRVVGICDSPIGLVRRAARAAGFPLRDGSLAGVDYVGLNHLGWLRGLHATGDGDRDSGRDYLPALLQHPEQLAAFEEGRLFGLELLRALGALPNEYLFYYYLQREALAGLAAGQQTRGESIDAQQASLYPTLAGAGQDAYRLWDAARRSREEGYLAEARTGLEGADATRDEADLAGGGYEQVALSAMAALLTGQSTELILNVPNGNAIAGLPADAVIEVPCRIDASGAVPLPVRPPEMHQLGLMSQLKAVETAVVEAVTTGNRSAAERAFMLHPLIDSARVGADLLTDYEKAFPALTTLWQHGELS